MEKAMLVIPGKCRVRDMWCPECGTAFVESFVPADFLLEQNKKICCLKCDTVYTVSVEPTKFPAREV